MAQSAELLAQKWDKTLADFAIKSSTGLTVGIALSFLLFKRKDGFIVEKKWPVALCFGFGTGMAYADSRKHFNIWTGQ